MTAPVLLITGASSGIGAATAHLAARKGWSLVLAARSRPALDALVDDLGGPAKAVAVPCDVQDWEQVAALSARAEEAFGMLDAVFANAGVFTPTSFLQATGSPERWREMVLTNVYGATLPALVRSRGHLLLTGSVTGRVTVPGQLYSRGDRNTAGSRRSDLSVVRGASFSARSARVVWSGCRPLWGGMA